MFSFLRPYIFTLDPEAAHDLAIKSLKLNFLPKSFFQVENEEMLSTELFKKKRVYIASNNDMGEPQAEYIERINAGIKSANLPDDYVEQWIRPFVPEN